MSDKPTNREPYVFDEPRICCGDCAYFETPGSWNNIGVCILKTDQRGAWWVFNHEDPCEDFERW